MIVPVIGWADWVQLLAHYLVFSLISVGGAITVLPEMHRLLVVRQHWLSDAQFSASVALAQASPGPNILFVALMGWNVGLNAGSTWLALVAAILCLVSVLLPSSVLAVLAARWGHRNRERRAVRAFKQGMSPIVVSLLIATGWILASANGDPARDWPLWAVTAVSALVVWRTKVHLLWLLALGALLGAAGLL
jgi:chromate transporter